MGALVPFRLAEKHSDRGRHPDWRDPPSECDQCRGPVMLVQNQVLYHVNQGWPALYYCPCCGASVGCHIGTTYPLGTMADPATRAARAEVHQAFDVLWDRCGGTSRNYAYAWLGGALGYMPGRTPHIGEMDLETCRRAVEAVRRATVVDDFG